MVHLYNSRPRKVWAVQYNQRTNGGNEDEIAKFCEFFGYQNSVYRNPEGCIAVYCHGRGLQVVRHEDMVIRTEDNRLDVVSLSDLESAYDFIENPEKEYRIAITWLEETLPTAYKGGVYNDIEVVKAILKSKQKELGFDDQFTDDFIPYVEKTLLEQMPCLSVQNMDDFRAATCKSKVCKVKCWRSK